MSDEHAQTPSPLPLGGPDADGWYRFGPKPGWGGLVASYVVAGIVVIATLGAGLGGVAWAAGAVASIIVAFAVLSWSIILETRIRSGRVEQRLPGRRRQFDVDRRWCVRYRHIGKRPDDIGAPAPAVIDVVDPDGRTRVSWNERGGPSPQDAAAVLGIEVGEDLHVLPLVSRRPWLVISIVIATFVLVGIALVWITQSGCCL